MSLTLPRVLVILLLWFVYPVWSQSTKTLAKVNLKTMYGESFNTAQLDNKGKPMIIVVWRTDRRNCYRYFQDLNEALPEFRVEAGVKIVIISTDPPKSAPEVLPMVKAKQWDFESYIDTYQEFKTAMGIVGIPYTFVVNGKGEVVWEKQSYFPGQEDEVYEEVMKIVRTKKDN